MKSYKNITTALFAGLLLMGLAACEKGPAEKPEKQSMTQHPMLQIQPGMQRMLSRISWKTRSI